MFSSWWSGKPKEQFSLENLKYLHGQLVKNPNITDGNRDLIVEVLRSIAELMIWGDQHNSAFFDFFCEKNIISFFHKILHQRTPSRVKVQMIQTLSIMIHNIQSEHSVFYFLSNNHLNDLIVYKFDFSDEELLSHYISFLKTLSFKLSSFTLPFFFNERAQDFPLYTEALKFACHDESMVRAAVRTLTLNVYQINDAGLRSFLFNRSALPYFFNLISFIRHQCFDVDRALLHSSYQDVGKIADLIDQRIDHFYYLEDVIHLKLEPLSNTLIDQLLAHFIFPLLFSSLLPDSFEPESDRADSSSTQAPLPSSSADSHSPPSELVSPKALPIAAGLNEEHFASPSASTSKPMFSSSSSPSSASSSNEPRPSSSPLRVTSSPAPAPSRLQRHLALFLLSQLFTVFRDHAPLCQALVSALLAPHPLQAISLLAYQAPALPVKDHQPVTALLLPSPSPSSSSSSSASNADADESKEMVSPVKSGKITDLDQNLKPRSELPSNVEVVALSQWLPQTALSPSSSNMFFESMITSFLSGDELLVFGSASLLFNIFRHPLLEEKLLSDAGIFISRFRSASSSTLSSCDESKSNDNLESVAEEPPTLSSSSSSSSSSLMLSPVNPQLEGSAGSRLLTALLHCLYRHSASIRLASVHLLVSLVESLVLDSKGFRVAELSTPDADMILSSYNLVKQRLRTLMEESLVGDAFLDMIEDEFRALILKSPSIDQLSSNAVALFAISEATPTSIDFTFRLPVGDFEKTRRNVQLLLILHKLRRQLQISKSSISANDNIAALSSSSAHSDGTNSSAYNSSQVSTWMEWLQDDSALLPVSIVPQPSSMSVVGFDSIACYLFDGQRRQRVSLIVHPEYLFLVEPSLQQADAAMIHLRVPLHEQEVLRNRSDPRVLHLVLRTAQKPHSSCVLIQVNSGPSFKAWQASLLFEERQQCSTSCELLQKLREQRRHSIIMQFLSFLRTD